MHRMIGLTPDKLEIARQSVKRGEIIIFPTDTVYGIGCRPDSEETVREIYRLKGRPKGRPLQILISDTRQVERYATRIPDYGMKIMKAFWPGGITILLSARRGLPAYCVGPGLTVGLRQPNHPELLDLIKSLGGAIASTSANLSGEEDPLSIEQIPADLCDGASCILDGGILPPSSASTVLDCTDAKPSLIREGAIPTEALKNFGLDD